MFTKLDLEWEYNNVGIKEGDSEKWPLQYQKSYLN